MRKWPESQVSFSSRKKGFFYKNEQVRSLLNEEKKDQGTLARIKREVRDKSLEKQVELYQREIKRLLNENEVLRKEPYNRTRKN